MSDRPTPEQLIYKQPNTTIGIESKAQLLDDLEEHGYIIIPFDEPIRVYKTWYDTTNNNTYASIFMETDNE